MPSLRDSVIKFFTFLFGIWLALFLFLLLITAAYDRKYTDLIGVLSLITYGIIFGVFWNRRAEIVDRFTVNKNASLGNFMLVGWLTAMFIELLLFFTFSYQHGVNIILDFAYTTPTYLGLVFGWWIFINRFPLSNREIFYLAGLNGFLAEAPQKIISGQGLFGMLIGAPLHIFIYGSLILVPITLLGLSTPKPEAPVFKKYLFGLLVVPLIVLPTYILSVAILLAGKKFFG